MSPEQGQQLVKEIAPRRWQRWKHWPTVAGSLHQAEQPLGVVFGGGYDGKPTPTFEYGGFVTTERVILYRAKPLLGVGGKGYWEAQLSELHTVRNLQTSEGVRGLRRFQVTVFQTIGGDELSLNGHECGVFAPPYDKGDFARSMTQFLAGPQAAPTAPSGPSMAEELANLDDLRRRGILSDSDFEAAKRKVIG